MKTKNKIKAYLIGKNIHKSYSPELYREFFDVDYNIKNFEKESELKEFILSKKYKFLNITTPYKEEVIKYLDSFSKLVEQTKTCNLIVNKNGKLKGYNTDVYGFKKLITKNKINIKDKTCLILGNGATSRTVEYVLNELNAKCVYVSCRHKKKSTDFLFKEAPRNDVEIIVNTTPLGIKTTDRRLAYISNYPKIEFYIDVLYQSYKTPTMVDAKDNGVGSINGLDMLIYQAQMASFIVFNKVIPTTFWNTLKNQILLKTVNLVLIGLPTSGKTQMCKSLEKLLNSKDGNAFIDTDDIIEKTMNETISQIFKKEGEEFFRAMEKETTKAVTKTGGKVISTGGGLVLNRENYLELSKNGFIIYLKKTRFEDFKNDNKRPLVKSKEDLYRLYNERNPIYEKRADLTIMSDMTAEELIKEACDAITNS